MSCFSNDFTPVGASPPLAVSPNRVRLINATWEADVRTMFWSIAGFVTIGLIYVIAIGAMHR
jgi:hypothetical protein